MNLFLAVAGNIGVGKSTLTKLLADALGGKPFFEPTNQNPYLADFYQDMARWGFHSQIYFLGRRLKDHASLLNESGILIQDRSLYENAEVFARNLYDRGYIRDRDWNIYQEIYQTAIQLLRPPDLIIYLQASVPSLVDRIRSRGRAFEQKIDSNYLENLNRLYDRWSVEFPHAPLLTISTDEIRYHEDPQQFEMVLDLIRKKLGGLPARIL